MMFLIKGIIMLTSYAEIRDPTGTLHFTLNGNASFEITYSIEEQKKARAAGLTSDNISDKVLAYINSDNFKSSCAIKINSNAEIIFEPLSVD
jgi:hypothetical protein